MCALCKGSEESCCEETCFAVLSPGFPSYLVPRLLVSCDLHFRNPALNAFNFCCHLSVT